MADTTVKLFHWQQVSAPTLSGAAGGLIPLLDACLVNGFGLVTVDSLVVASGVATVTRSGGHSAILDGVQTLAGITGTYASLNGEQKVTFVNATTFRFACPGSPDGSATGTITTKCAPLGYTKVYSGTNKAAYKANDVTSLGMYLRVDDTVTKNAIVKGYEAMTDVDTGTGLFANATAGNWPKSSTTDATARPWIIIGDTRGFYLWTEPNVTTGGGVTSQGIVNFFGDIIPRRSGDAYACVIVSQGLDNTNTTTNSVYDMGLMNWTPTQEDRKIARSQTGLGGQQYFGIYSASRKFTSSAVSYSGDGGSQVYPNAADNGVDFDEVLVSDQDNNSIRGRFPGLLHLPQQTAFAFATFDTLAGAGDLSGKKLIFVRLGLPGYTSQNSTNGRTGVVAFDLTGPWR